MRPTCCKQAIVGQGSHAEGPAAENITILGRFNNAAVVKIVASGWVDYLEEVKWNGQWKIINVLWELKAQPTAPKPDK